MVVLVVAIEILLLPKSVLAVKEVSAADLVETTTKGGILTKDRMTTGTGILAEIISDISHSLPFRFSMMESTSLRGKMDLMI